MKKFTMLVVGLCLASSQALGAAAEGDNSTEALPLSFNITALPPNATRFIEELDNCPANAFTIKLKQELTNVGDKLERVYYSEVVIGGMSTNIRFDTTARDNWLPKRDYDCQEWDTSCKRVKEESEIQVLGRTIRGSVHEGTIKFCDNLGHWLTCGKDNAAEKIIELSQLRLLVALKVSDEEKGAIGLSSNNVNDLGGTTFLKALAQLELRPQFGLYLSPTLMDKPGYGGELMIGCVNKRRYNRGTGRYHSLVGDGEDGWKVRLNGVKFGDKRIDKRESVAILDTGSERIRAPRAAFEEIRKMLRARRSSSGVWTVDCKKSQPIKMTFTIDERLYSIDSKSYLMEIEEGSCRLNIDPWDKREWALGTSFLRNYYTIFDLDEPRVRFANPNNS